MPFVRDDVGGPYRFVQNRSRTSAVAQKATQQPKTPRINFREIFRIVRFSFLFCNSICHERKLYLLAWARFAVDMSGHAQVSVARGSVYMSSAEIPNARQV